MKPSDHATELARFSHLKSLRVVIELRVGTSDFAAEYLQNRMGTVEFPPLNEALGQEMVTKLFKVFFKNDRNACMTDLEVWFLRRLVYDNHGQGTDVGFPIRIRRAERDDAPSPLDGGFTVECGSSWLGE